MLNPLLKTSLLFIVICSLLSCTKEIPADPTCRVQEQQKILAPAASVCLIKLDGKLIAVKTKNMQRWDLPRNKQQNDTSAQCTAHQAAWKTTGLNVSVDKLLFVDQANIHYFACIPSSQFSDTGQDFPIPSWASHRVEKIGLLDPFATSKQDWDTQLDVIQLREAFTQLENEEALFKPE